MTKNELKTGMVVTLRNGDKLRVFRDYASDWTQDENESVCMVSTVCANDWWKLSAYTDDMKYEDDETCDIMEVYRPYHPYDFLRDFDESRYNLIWKREDPKEMTMAEIEAALGYKIKIVERK